VPGGRRGADALIVTLNLMIGLITPPIGLVMFTVMQITRIPIETFARAIWPFFIALVMVVALRQVPPKAASAMARQAAARVDRGSRPGLDYS
jgi:TRAP-type C4-dicarboxylate transport system permease large subunit